MLKCNQYDETGIEKFITHMSNGIIWDTRNNTVSEKESKVIKFEKEIYVNQTISIKDSPKYNLLAGITHIGNENNETIIRLDDQIGHN